MEFEDILEPEVAAAAAITAVVASPQVQVCFGEAPSMGWRGCSWQVTQSPASPKASGGAYRAPRLPRRTAHPLWKRARVKAREGRR